MRGSLKFALWGAFCVIMLTGAASAWAQQPQGFLPEYMFNAGKVVAGTTVSHTFVLENRGDADFIIEKIITGCGCATTAYDEVIPPGGQGNITVNFNTNGYKGFVERRFTIVNNDPQRPKMTLVLKTEILRGASITPERVEFIGRSGEEMTREVTIIPMDNYPLKITDHSCRFDKNIRYELKEVDSNGKMGYLLTVYNIKQNVGRYFDEIVLKTDSDLMPVISIRVNGTILPEE